MNVASTSLSEVKFNPVVPKHSKAFLLLSSEMAKLARSPNASMNWLELDRLCQRVFLQQGYDLMTGAWFCLIQLRLAGWSGAAKSLELFASALSFGERHGQDVVDIELPRSMLTWFIANGLTPMYTQSQSAEDGQAMSRAESALDIISRQAKKLKVRDADTLSNLCYFLQVRARSSNNIVLDIDPEQQMQLVCKSSPEVVSAPQAQHEESASPEMVVHKEEKGTWFTLGVLAATLLISVISGGVWAYLSSPNEPEAVSALTTILDAEKYLDAATAKAEMLTDQQIADIDSQLQIITHLPASWLLQQGNRLAEHLAITHPNNLASSNWRAGLLQYPPVTTHAGGWLEIQQRLHALETRLLESEKKQRNHITISELKTEVYEMKQALQKMETPVSVLLWMREELREKGESENGVNLLIEDSVNRLMKQYTQTKNNL